jgi:hypothetical protein
VGETPGLHTMDANNFILSANKSLAESHYSSDLSAAIRNFDALILLRYIEFMGTFAKMGRCWHNKYVDAP